MNTMNEEGCHSLASSDRNKIWSSKALTHFMMHDATILFPKSHRKTLALKLHFFFIHLVLPCTCAPSGLSPFTKEAFAVTPSVHKMVIKKLPLEWEICHPLPATGLNRLQVCFFRNLRLQSHQGSWKRYHLCLKLGSLIQTLGHR